MTIMMTRPPRRPSPTASTRFLSPSVPHRPRNRSRRAARYRRRRAAVTLFVAGVVGGGALLADSVLTGPGGVPATAAGAGRAPGSRSVRAAPGDSLWSIAAEHRGEIGITRYVEELINLNDGTRIEAGQLVHLP